MWLFDSNGHYLTARKVDILASFAEDYLRDIDYEEQEWKTVLSPVDPRTIDLQTNKHDAASL